jgi:hypothetical protein
MKKTVKKTEKTPVKKVVKLDEYVRRAKKAWRTIRRNERELSERAIKAWATRRLSA